MKSRKVLEAEINHYKKQLKALEIDDTYNNHEDKREVLRSVYESKIKGHSQLLGCTCTNKTVQVVEAFDIHEITVVYCDCGVIG